MPHFDIECSSNVLAMQPAAMIMKTVYNTAELSGLFAPNDIKVRIKTYDHYQLGDGKQSFLHIYASIMEGRTTTQKATLSSLVIQALSPLLPGISFLSMNVWEFEAATYSNRSLIDPLNKDRDRHF